MRRPAVAVVVDDLPIGTSLRSQLPFYRNDLSISTPQNAPPCSLTAVHRVGPQYAHGEEMKDWAGSAHPPPQTLASSAQIPLVSCAYRRLSNTGVLTPQGEPTGGTHIPGQRGRSNLESQRTSLALENPLSLLPQTQPTWSQRVDCSAWNMACLPGSEDIFGMLPFLCWSEGAGGGRPEMNQPGWVRKLQHEGHRNALMTGAC